MAQASGGPLGRASRFYVAIACLHLCNYPAALSARGQAPPPVDVASAPPTEVRAERPRRLYLGMITSHLERHPERLTNNWLVGVTSHGYFGATFLNSFGRRAFTGGIERTLVATDSRPFGASFGYRVGFVTGYDARFVELARKTPILPFIHPFAMVNAGRLGVEVSYTFVVVSVATSFKF